MKIITLITVSLCLLVDLNAQSNLAVKAHRQQGNEDRVEVHLEFDSTSSRRYIIEVSEDLADWESHYLSPFEHTEEGYWVRSLDMSNPHTTNSEFYQVSRLPWSFQTLDNSGDWIGDLFLASSGSIAHLVYQNRDSNTLFYARSDLSGNFQSPEVIASTGAVDEPGFWDNSGFADVTIAHYDSMLYLVCTDDIAKKVTLLRKHDESENWIRHEISDEIDAHFWAFPKFAISSSGVLGVTYRTDEGTIFSYASHSAPQNWQSVFVTSDQPNNSEAIKTTFSTPTDAHVYLTYGGSFKISTVDGSVISESYPNERPTSLSPEEIESVESIYRYESISNYVRLQDGRIIIGLSDARRVVVAVED